MSRGQPSANPARRSILNTFLDRPPTSPLLHPPERPFTPDNPQSSSSSHHGGGSGSAEGGWGTSPEQPGPAQTVSYSPDKLHPSLPYLPAPNAAFARTDRADSNVSSRRSSFASSAIGSERKLGTRGGGGKGEDKPRPISLSVNYVPAKFTKLQSSSAGGSGMRRRKLGGGRGAWGEGENRMGMVGMVDDDEGVEWKMARGGVRRKGKRGMRWNRFKGVLFGANTVLMLYGLVTLVAAILVWLNVFSYADVIRVGNREELIVSTVAAALSTLTAVFGYSGIILNNRAFLAVYTLLLWIDLGFIAAPGYMTYKQRTFNLEGKLNQQWSRYLGTEGRLRIQDALVCCGYYSPFIEATNSPLCYARSNLPGCKGQYLRLERGILHTWYAVAFGIVGAHILIIVAALLCSNHVTYRFGKGLTPKRYRLDLRSMGVIMDDYANQIAAQYGDNVAQEALSRSVSHISASHPSDNLIDFASSPRRNSFAVPGLPDRSESQNGTFTTTSTGYNSQIQPDPRASVRLVSPANREEARSGEEGEWYQDAQEDELDRMEVSTGYGTVVEGSAGDARPRNRVSAGWAQ